LHQHRLTRELPYAPEEVFELVADVRSYPQFVRWISELRTWGRRELAPGVERLDAEATVRFGPLSERFATRVNIDRPALAVDVALISGPFKRLENHWRFAARPGGSQLSFEIDFEFTSHLLEGLLAANFDRAADTLVRCFEVRADQLYGGGEWTRPTGS
jgi:coenzyme Q-binding protein COQ10